MKVIVCGSRDEEDRAFVFGHLDALDLRYGPFSIVVHGDQRGADRIAQSWALTRHREQRPYPYLRQHGRAGGPLRNAQMLRENPDLVIAMPGGTGTQNMITQARAAGFKVIEVADTRETLRQARAI